MARLMRGLILQAHAAIVSGSEPAIEGNLRTFWYRWVKPVLGRIPDDERLKSDPYEMMLAAFAELVMERGEVAYADFDFTDENWAHRFIGQRHPEVVVFAEKRGWIRFLRRCHEDLGTSALALGGMPSALTSEYTLRALAEVVEEGTMLKLWGIVDWDPSGAIIAQAFAAQMRALGWDVVELDVLIGPQLYTPEELRMARVPLPRGQPTKTREWLDRTGGVGGEAFGLESESMPWDRLMRLIEQKLEES
jgi:hypothetical protein